MAEQLIGTCFSPWSDEEVDSLNGYQKAGVFHPFTCGNCRDRYGVYETDWPLFATRYGWRCKGCSYEQNWAWRFMADGSWKRSAQVFGWEDD